MSESECWDHAKPAHNHDCESLTSLNNHLVLLLFFFYFFPPHCDIFHLSVRAVLSPSPFLPVSRRDAKVPNRVSSHVFICIGNGLAGRFQEVSMAAWEMCKNTEGRGEFVGALSGRTNCDHPSPALSHLPHPPIGIAHDLVANDCFSRPPPSPAIPPGTGSIFFYESAGAVLHSECRTVTSSCNLQDEVTTGEPGRGGKKGKSREV